MRHLSVNYIINYIWAILWGAIICILLLLPSNNFNNVPIPLFEGIDKIVHLGIFFVQATLLYWEAAIKSKRTANKWLTVLKVIIITGIFACLTELAQNYFTTSRTGDAWDIAADIIGVGMATFAFVLLYKQEKV